MVATIKALSPGYSGDYHMNPKASDYYTGKREDRGQWYGQGCHELGLTGSVTDQAFRNLLNGCDPATGKALVKQFEERCPGVDMTFSCPADVSAVWAVGNAHEKKQVEKAFLKSVHNTLTFIEERFALGRFGKGGHIKENVKIVTALFPHFCNRNGDPQLHCHAVILNVGIDKNGKHRAINTKELFEWTRTLGPLQRSALAGELQKELQFDCKQAVDSDGKKQSWFALKGVPQQLRDRWSSRRKEIEEFTRRDGALGKVSAKARAFANSSTRKSKDRLPHIDRLQEYWKQDATEFGFTFDSIRRVQNLIPDAAIAKLNQVKFRGAIKATITHLSNDQSNFTYRDILRGVAERTQTLGYSPQEIANKVEQSLSRSQSIIQLHDKKGELRYTTKKIWQAEQAMISSVEKLQNRRGAQAKESKILSSIRLKPGMDQEQVDAVRALTTQDGSIRLLHGIAGSGKSYTLDAVRKAFESSGYKVLGGAISGIAKENLADGANIESRTVASYLYSFSKESELFSKATPILDRKTVLVIDEAGMLDTKSMSKLLKEVQKAKATIILCGDDKQLQPIGAGGPFNYLKSRIEGTSLSVNRRQVNKEDQAALESIRGGTPLLALQKYAERKLVSVLPSRVDAAKKLVQEVIKSGGGESPKDHVVFTETKKEAGYINRKIQEARLSDGYLDPASKVKGLHSSFLSGDRVLFTKGDRVNGIENGYRATILSTNTYTGSVRVELDTPKRGLPSIINVPRASLMGGDVELGYASTTHKGQGSTAQNSYVLLGGGMTNLNMAYTQLSRAKHTSKIFLDEESAGKDLKSIAQRISRSVTKTLAHEFEKVTEKRQVEQRRVEIEHDRD